jgi:hypothetical protein
LKTPSGWSGAVIRRRTDNAMNNGKRKKQELKLYDKRDDFNFPIVSFPFICSNIPIMILDWGLLLVNYGTKGSYWLSWGHHFESCTVATITWLTVTEYWYHKLPHHNPILSSFMTYYCACNKSKTTGTTCGTGYPY